MVRHKMKLGGEPTLNTPLTTLAGGPIWNNHMNDAEHHKWMQSDLEWFRQNPTRSFRYRLVSLEMVAALTGADLSRIDPEVFEMLSTEQQLLIAYLEDSGTAWGTLRHAWAFGLKVASLQAHPEALHVDMLALAIMRHDDVLVPPVDKMTVILRDPNTSFGKVVV